MGSSSHFSRRPIEERVVTALGKHWHIEHFACAKVIFNLSYILYLIFCTKCEKPFLGNRHYERKGLAYCATHYHQVKYLQIRSSICINIYKNKETIPQCSPPPIYCSPPPAVWKPLPPLRRGDRGRCVHRSQQGLLVFITNCRYIYIHILIQILNKAC